MKIRTLAAVVAVTVAVGLAGCSKSDTPSTTAGGGVTTTAGAPTTAAPAVDLSSVSTIAAADCVVVAKGKLDVLTAKTAAEAKAAGEAMKTAKPPADVAKLIDELVGYEGDVVAMSSGKGKPAYDTVNAWFEKLCPSK